MRSAALISLWTVYAAALRIRSTHNADRLFRNFCVSTTDNDSLIQQLYYISRTTGSIYA